MGGLHTFEESHLEDDVIHRKEAILKKVRALEEVNPMLGHRGVRLGISYPEIYSMQIRAILEAAALCAQGRRRRSTPRSWCRRWPRWRSSSASTATSQRIHKVVELTHGINVKFKFGTMLEVVRACVRAGRMAETAEFFSFGTNDLTQATFSFSREDAENKFLPAYTETGILQDNPFEVLDIKGVGQLMKMAVAKGRETRPDLKVGICGEHGGDPGSIHFCHHIGHHVRVVLRPARAGGAAGGGPGQAAGGPVRRPGLIEGIARARAGRPRRTPDRAEPLFGAIRVMLRSAAPRCGRRGTLESSEPRPGTG